MGSITIFTLLFITTDAFSTPPKRLGNVADRTRSRGARRGPAPTMAFSTVTEKPARAAMAAAYVCGGVALMSCSAPRVEAASGCLCDAHEETR